MLHYLKILSAISTWTLAVTLAVLAQPGRWGLCIFVATVACVPTFWLMVDAAADNVCRKTVQTIHDERKHTEDVMLAIAVEFARSEVPRLRSHSRG